MLLLAATTDLISVITSTTSTIDVHASWVDNNAGTISFGKTNTAITTATTGTTIVGSPGASTTRNAKNINIRNKDASIATYITVQYNANGTLYELFKTVLQAGETLSYVEGVGWYLYTANTGPSLFKVLTADDTGGTAGTSAQPWFPTNGSLTVPATTSFLMDGMLKITHGATSHSTGLSFGGTATLTSIDYYAQAHRTAADTISSTFSGINVTSASNATVDAAGTQAATYIQIKGVIRINATGTLIPQFTFSANPTGTITVKRNSFFRLTAIGDNTVATSGTWA